MTVGPAAVLRDLFKRRFWIVVLAAITLVSYLTTQGLNGLVSASLAPFTVPGPTGLIAPVEAGSNPSGGAELIARLLMGDPGQVAIPEAPIPEEPVQTVAPETPPAETPDGCAPSSVNAVLVGTMVDGSGRWSYGIVQDQTANRTALVRPGMWVAGAEGRWGSALATS